MTAWTFFSNHGHVLLCLAGDPEARLRDVAERVGITERAVTSIVRDLEEAGVITKTREGRRNSYEIHGEITLRHPVEEDCTVGDLVRMAAEAQQRRAGGRTRRRRIQEQPT